MTSAPDLKWLVIGFDARITLQRPTLASVDTEIWPSIFDDAHLKRPQWIGPIQDLWDDIQRLEAEVVQQKQWRFANAVMIIAVAVLLRNRGGGAESGWYRRADGIRPATIDPTWTFIGFDVADEYLESAVDIVVRDGTGRYDLNAWSLFDRMDAAESAAIEMDRLYPQRTAHFVYGLWEVR